MLDSPPETLRAFGFDRAHVAADAGEGEGLARSAAQAVLDDTGVDPASIDLLVLFGGIPREIVPGAGEDGAGEEPPGAKGDLIELFRYPVNRLQHELGLTGAVAMAVGQQGCASMMSALRLARNAIAAGDGANVLLVGSDVVPPGFSREVIYNVLSDAACAALVTVGEERLQPVAFRQVTKAYYWDSPARRDEIIAAYLPTARNVILGAVKDAGLEMDDIALLVPDNVSRRSWEIVMDLVGVGQDRVFLENIPRRGHSVSCDNLVNLKDALAVRDVPEGAPVLLFTFGFGANWSAVVLRA